MVGGAGRINTAALLTSTHDTQHWDITPDSTTGPLVYLGCQIIVDTLPTHPDPTETSLSVSVFCN